MEKIRFGNKIYDLVPAGTNCSDKRLSVVLVWPESGTYEEIETSLTGIDRIEVLSDGGDVLEAFRGYTSVHQLQKRFDQIIGYEQVEDGQDENGETLYINQPVTGTVMAATLKKPDIKDNIKGIQETLDKLVIKSLMGGI